MSGDLLRRAAAKLREHAQAATHGPWEVGPNFGARDNTVYVRPEGGFDWIGSTYRDTGSPEKVMTCQVANVPHFRANAAFVAMMHPPVALALADALDCAATDADYAEAFPRSEMAIEDGSNLFAVARTVLCEPEVTP